MTKKVVFCIPTMERPMQPCLDALEAAVPTIKEAGWDEGTVFEVGCPYISCARATMLRKALDAKADVIVFIDHDVSFRPQDLLKLIETPGDVVAGVYRYKKDEEEYMGVLSPTADGIPVPREDGCVKADRIPAGFLKITPEAVCKIMIDHPELCYGPKFSPSVDLFNHGAHEGIWWGEDYAFSRRWVDGGGEIWVIPDLSLTHHSRDKEYPGNFHHWLLCQPGGREELKEAA